MSSANKYILYPWPLIVSKSKWSNQKKSNRFHSELKINEFFRPTFHPPNGSFSTEKIISSTYKCGYLLSVRSQLLKKQFLKNRKKKIIRNRWCVNNLGLENELRKKMLKSILESRQTESRWFCLVNVLKTSDPRRQWNLNISISF